jgi:ankyrin repeat protein
VEALYRRGERLAVNNAARYGLTDVVELLLERWQAAMCEDPVGDTPLHGSARAGQIDVVKLSLKRWPEAMWRRQVKGYTPLHYAAHWGRVDVVRFLVGLWPEGKKALTKKRDRRL